MLKRLFQSSSPDLAIDLGTANTLLAAAGYGVLLSEPSVVAVEQGTSRVLSGGKAVGHLARQLLGRTPQSISVVRPLRDGVITDFELCEAMLRYFLDKARQQGWKSKPRVLVAVPGCITPVEHRAVLTSAERAGASQVHLISQAKAAALGAGLPIAEPLASMICDIGGGTTEVAVISLAETIASESIRVGGDSMDAAIIHYLRRQYSLRVAPAAAEELRIGIGSAYPLPQEQVAETRGIDAISGLPRKAIVTSEEIREALAAPLMQIVDAIRQTLDACPPELAADLIDSGLLLAGGGALLRGIDRYLAEATGLPTRVYEDPMNAVASGAVICLENFSKWRSLVQRADRV